MAKRNKENHKQTKEKTHENKTSKSINMQYNPFTYETKIEGLTFGKNSKLKNFIEKNKDLNIQLWIQDFFYVLEKEINTKFFNLNFKGRNEEFEDVEEEVLKLNEKGWKINLLFDLVKTTNENIFKRLDEFVKDIKKNAPKELLEEIKAKQAFAEYEKSKNSEAYVSVIATMSSGKSTLINAVLEEELLPSKNEACTATICKIKDIDGLDEFRARVEDLEGNEIYSWKENVSNEFLEEVNEKGNKKGLNIYVEGDIPGISSEDMSLVMIDTPGPNNSQNEEHKAATYRYIKDNETNPLVLYVMNATQHATNDDNRLLNEIAEIIQRKGKQAEERFLFALNKIDAFDVEKEDVEKLIENNKEYLRGKGIKNPKIFPISAEFSKLKKLEIKGKKLTRTQKNNLETFKSNFMPDLDDDYEGIDTIKYASISLKLKKELYEEAKKDEDKGHLHYSGITAIEKYIDRYVSKYAKTQKIKDSIVTMKLILDSKYEEYMLSQNKTQSELNELKKQIESVEELLARKGKKQIEIVKNSILNITTNQDIFEQTMAKIGKTFADLEYDFMDSNCNETKAENIVREAMMSLENLLIQLKTDSESIVNDQLKEKSNEIISNLKKYFTDILGEVDLDKDTENTLSGLFNSELPRASRLVSENLRTESVYKGERFSHTEKTGSWYKPWSWGSTRDVYIDVYEDETRVNLTNIFEEELRPLRVSFSNPIDKSFNNLEEQIESLKSQGIKSVTIVEKQVNQKINELKEKISIQSKLGDSSKKIGKNMNLTVEYKKQIDNILSI